MVEKNETIECTLSDFGDNGRLGLLSSIAEKYPAMVADELSRLRDDILYNNGILTPLLATSRDGKYLIFDGRNRYNILHEICNNGEGDPDYESLKETKFLVDVYPDNETELGYIADSYNLSRRHLSPRQKAILAFSPHFKDVREQFSAIAKKNQEEGKKKESQMDVAKELAEIVGGTNKTYINQWNNIEKFFDGGKKETAIYDKLKQRAYSEQGKHFAEVASLFSYPKNKDVNFDDENTRKNIIKMCNAYFDVIEQHKGKNINAQQVDKLKHENNLPIKEKVERASVAKPKDFWIYINMPGLSETAQIQITKAIKNVLDGQDDSILDKIVAKGFKCYLPKNEDECVSINKRMMKVVNSKKVEQRNYD